MFDQEFNEVARWNFTSGWPSKVSGPSPKADGNEVGIEELTIVHEGIERKT
jgi:phage tail-like protein